MEACRLARGTIADRRGKGRGLVNVRHALANADYDIAVKLSHVEFPRSVTVVVVSLLRVQPRHVVKDTSDTGSPVGVNGVRVQIISDGGWAAALRTA